MFSSPWKATHRWQVAGVAVAVAGIFLSGWHQKTFAQTTADAKAAIQSRKYDQAITDLRNILKVKPKDADAHYLLGVALKAKGQQAEAVTEFQAAIKENKKLLDAYYDLGLLQIDLKQLDGADKTLLDGDKMAKGKEPRFAYAQGLLRVVQGKMEEAKSLMTLATSSQPGNAVFQRGMGDVYMAMKVWPIAITAYNKALSMEPNSPNAAFAHNQLGKLYFESRQFNQAIEEYKKALALDPDLNEAYYQQGYIMFLAKQYAGVVEPLQKAIEKGYNNAETNFMLGKSLNETQRPKMAVPYLQKAVELDPSKVEAYAGIAEGLVAQGQYREALDAAQKAVKQNPKDFDLVYLLGWLQSQADIGQYDAGIVTLNKAVELNPASEKPHIQLALTYFDQGKFAEATPHLNQAIAINPTDQNSYAYYGRSFIKQKLYEQAVAKVKEKLEPVLQRLPVDEKAKLSNVYASLGQELYGETRTVGEDKELRITVLKSAIDMLRAKLPYDSTSYSTYLYIGLSSLVLSDGAQARDSFLKALDLRKNDPKDAVLQTKKYLGTSYLVLQDYDNARKVYEDILTINAQDDEAYGYLAQVALQRKNYAVAIQNARKAADLKPDKASYHLIMAQAYTNSQQLAAAVKEYSETLRLDPNNNAARSQLDTVRKAMEQMGKK